MSPWLLKTVTRNSKGLTSIYPLGNKLLELPLAELGSEYDWPRFGELDSLETGGEERDMEQRDKGKTELRITASGGPSSTKQHSSHHPRSEHAVKTYSPCLQRNHMGMLWHTSPALTGNMRHGVSPVKIAFEVNYDCEIELVTTIN